MKYKDGEYPTEPREQRDYHLKRREAAEENGRRVKVAVWTLPLGAS